MKLKARAKLNLYLKVLGRRPDGFHDIESVMQSVSLCDLITLTSIPSGVRLTTDDSRLTTDDRNLAYRAAELYIQSQKCGIKIHIEKRIPIAAGLAGGSADAAAVLYGLNQLQTEDQRLKTEDLLKIGAQVGSDVPFCLVGGNCTVRGRGEHVTRNPQLATRSFVLVVPELEVSARWAYEEFDKLQTSKSKLQNKPQSPNLKSQNDLEPIVSRKYPVIQEIKEKLLKLGCSSAQMSGSGPAVFGFPGSKGIADEMKKYFPASFLVETESSGIEITP